MNKQTMCRLFAVLSVVLCIAACGSSSSNANNNNNNSTGTGDAVGQIANNHGHSAVLTKAQLDAGQAVVLDIQGTATHTHSLSLTAAQVTGVNNGSQEAQESSVAAGHSHMVTFN